MDPEGTNVGSFYLATGYKIFTAYCAEIKVTEYKEADTKPITRCNVQCYELEITSKDKMIDEMSVKELSKFKQVHKWNSGKGP